MTTNSGNPNVTPAPSIHNLPPKATSGFSIASQIQSAAAFIIEAVIGQVLIAFGGVTIFGVKPFEALAILGQSLVKQANDAYSKATTAQTAADTANTKSDNIIDAIVAASGIASVGNDIASIPVAIIAATEQAGAQFLQGLAAFLGFGSTQAAQITALQNNAGAAMSDDFATATVAGYTNIVPTLAVSSRGPYLQTPNIAVAYRNAGFATDKHGIHIVIGNNMQGAIRAGISCDTTASNYAAIEVYSGFSGDAVRLVTGSSPTLTAVQEQFDMSGSNRLQSGTTFDVKYDPTANTFYVLINGQPAFSWPDLTNIVTHGGSKRKPLLVTNAFNRNEDSFYGPGISKVVCYDWT